ncbi:murL [Symbiodinium natans]|uniref:MurL protein n=1 Tax=Symbiodinium natans TaxID=878477 RepID=A0A812UV73_9DINO|nr:murL [Symbiodinium natans]
MAYLDGIDLPPSSSDEGEVELQNVEDVIEPAQPAQQPFLRFKSAQVRWPRIRFTYTVCDAEEIHSECFLPDEIACQGPPREAEKQQRLDIAVLHVGLVVLAWYWMACGHKRVVVSAGYLDPEQVAWWEWFYAHCFAEFAVVNNFTEEQIRVSVEVDSPPRRSVHVMDAAPARVPCAPGAARVLCLLGGGKDSLVVHQMLQDAGVMPTWLYVGDGQQEFQESWRLQAVVQRSGSSALVMSHDFQNEALLKLRKSKKLRPCGHPWAALVGFDAVLVAILHGFDYIAVGNERSANYGNDLHVGSLEVNHQFDKSFDFESRMHMYIRRRLAPGVYYFSALKHLWEVQIAWLFCRRSGTFLDAFISCNESNGLNEWCCDCEKCCFVFALLAAWVSPGDVATYFGKNLFESPKLLHNFHSLLGISRKRAVKPFECVGTPDEVMLSLWLAHEASRFSPDGIPLVLASLPLDDGKRHLGLLCDYNPANLLPEWLAPQKSRSSVQEGLDDHVQDMSALGQKWTAFWSNAMSDTLAALKMDEA